MKITGDDLYKIGAEIAYEWQVYFESELAQYGLDFEFDKCLIEIYNDRGKYILRTNSTANIHQDHSGYYDIGMTLWGQNLPEDVTKSDEDVLEKFIEYCTKKFITSMGELPDKEWYITMSSHFYTFCERYPDDDKDKIIFETQVRLKYKK